MWTCANTLRSRYVAYRGGQRSGLVGVGAFVPCSSINRPMMKGRWCPIEWRAVCVCVVCGVVALETPTATVAC